MVLFQSLKDRLLSSMLADKKNVKCNYRDLFPQAPDEKILNCAEEGVLGFTTGIIGTMQANESNQIVNRNWRTFNQSVTDI